MRSTNVGTTVGPAGGGRPADAGQTTPLVALLFVMVAGALIALGHLGAVVADRSRARTAADAAALAGASDGEAKARAVAAANGGSVRRYVVSGPDVEITVEVGRAEATARAEVSWSNHFAAGH
jgi:hypothetical protein